VFINPCSPPCLLIGCILSYRIFQQQFCHAGKPVIVRDIQPQFFWDPDTLKRATKDTKWTWGRDRDGRKIQIKDAKPLKVMLFLLCRLYMQQVTVPSGMACLHYSS
jgi:hypothetical protein